VDKVCRCKAWMHLMGGGGTHPWNAWLVRDRDNGMHAMDTVIGDCHGRDGGMNRWHPDVQRRGNERMR